MLIYTIQIYKRSKNVSPIVFWRETFKHVQNILQTSPQIQLTEWEKMHDLVRISSVAKSSSIYIILDPSAYD
jgi:hypothetical protein